MDFKNKKMTKLNTFQFNSRLCQDYFKEASGLLQNDFKAKDLLELVLKMDEVAVSIAFEFTMTDFYSATA